MSNITFKIPKRCPSLQKRVAWINDARQYIPKVFGGSTFNRLFIGSHRFEVNITIHFQGHQTCDIDNACKAILDAMKGYVITDDRDIKKLCVEVIELTQREPYIEVQVIELPTLVDKDK